MRKKGFRICLMVLLLNMCIFTTAFAEGNLDDVINNNQEQTIEAETEAGSSFVDSLNKATDFTADVGKANEMTASAKPGFTLIVQLLTKLIVWGLTLRVLLDIAYVTIPFSRKLLGGGAPAPQQSTSGFGGGFGGSSFGGGGFGGSSFGGSPMGMQSQGAQQASFWVSGAAIKAANSETPMRIYMKDMAIMLTVVPILLVLNLTGVLTQVGVVIGNVLVDALRGLSGAI